MQKTTTFYVDSKDQKALFWSPSNFEKMNDDKTRSIQRKSSLKQLP